MGGGAEDRVAPLDRVGERVFSPRERVLRETCGERRPPGLRARRFPVGRRDPESRYFFLRK